MTTIEIKLDRIYRAAHVDLPAQAETYADMATELAASSAALGAEVSKTGHRLGRDLWRLGEELCVGLRSVTRTMNESARSLHAIAADFAEQDEEAAQWLRSHQRWLEDRPGFDSEPRTPPVPALPEKPDVA